MDFLDVKFMKSQTFELNPILRLMPWLDILKSASKFTNQYIPDVDKEIYESTKGDMGRF